MFMNELIAFTTRVFTLKIRRAGLASRSGIEVGKSRTPDLQSCRWMMVRRTPLAMMGVIGMVGVMGLSPMQLSAWPPETSQLIAGETVKYLPPALMALLKHFPDDLDAGFTSAQPAATQAALDAKLIASGEALEAQMRRPGDLPKFARQWGAYLRLVIEAADPLPGAAVAEPARDRKSVV